MNIPKKLTIGGHEYDIEVLNGGTRFTKYGDHSAWDNQIRINTDGTPESVQAEALFHELIEAINNRNELDLKHNVICSLSEGLFAIIRNNNLDFRKGK